MIKNLNLKFGRAIDSDPVTIGALPITVFVGPNNSGKSQVLSEIQRFCQSGNRNASSLIVDNVEFEAVPTDQVADRIRAVKLEPKPNETVQIDHVLVGKKGVRHQVRSTQLEEALQQPNSRPRELCQWYLAYNTLMLDGKNRINLVNQQGAGNLQDPPQSSFQVLFRDDARRKEVRRIIYEAFGKYLVIDPTNLGQLSLRLSQEAPDSDIIERGIHAEAVGFHSKATPINLASDGVKAFTGMITEMVAGDPSVMLIDEPEAFLHPSLSFKLGKEVATVMSGLEKRLFVSTHSPNFVMGCIQSGAPVNIVRLTYRDEVPTARVLPNSEILRLMRNPLLRSTGVLSGLFYEFVIVTESDADRAFYQEINDRLLKHEESEGIPNCLFLNAQNKQTVKTIIKPLRELGIPVAGIVDIDVVKEGGTVWTSFLDAGFIPEIERAPLANLRASLLHKFEEYGLFVVPGGELESWLSSLDASGHGPNWLIKVFEKMGENPNSGDYIHPSSGDVWAFLGLIQVWFFNQKRKGVPK